MTTPHIPKAYTKDIDDIIQSVADRSGAGGYIEQEANSLLDFKQMIKNLVAITKGGKGTWKDTGRAYNFILTNVFASLSSSRPYSDGTVMDYQDSQMNVLSGNLDIMGKGNLSLSDLQSYMNSLMQKTDPDVKTGKQEVSNFLYILDSMINILAANVQGSSKDMGADYSGVLNNLVEFRKMFNWQLAADGINGAPEPIAEDGRTIKLEDDIDPLTGSKWTDETKLGGTAAGSVVIDLVDSDAADPTTLIRSFNQLYKMAQTQADSKAGQAVQKIDNENNENKTTMGSIGGIMNTNLSAITNTQKNTGSQYGEMIKDDNTQKSTIIGNQKV